MLDAKSQQNATAGWESSVNVAGKHSIVRLATQLVFLSFLSMITGMTRIKEYNYTIYCN